MYKNQSRDKTRPRHYLLWQFRSMVIPDDVRTESIIYSQFIDRMERKQNYKDMLGVHSTWP